MRLLARLLSVFLLSSPRICAVPQEQPVFRADVSLVRVDIAAVDASGGILTGLNSEDFRVRDDGAEQHAASFGFEKEALDLILLFDTSHGMGSKIHQILRAVELGFHELHTGDRVCLMAFSSTTSEVAPFTADMDATNRNIVLKVLNSGFAGTAKPETAASEAARRFGREPINERRRAVLMIGGKSGSRSAVEIAIRDLWRADAVFGQLIPEKPGKNTILPAGENPIADRTGGETIVAGDPGPAFQDSLRRLRRRYTFYYQMPYAAPGAERRIEVALSPEAAKRFPGAMIHARTGYVAAGRR